MTNRITVKDLEGTISRINQAAGMPTEAYTKDDDGKYSANIGSYHLDQAYGGSRLVRMMSDGGGISVVSSGGFIPKRELYNQLHTLLNYLYSVEN